MEMLVIPKNNGSKYVIQDKKGRVLYTVKKKGFGGRYNLLDASDYNLYTLLQTDEGRKPVFSIILNDAKFLTLTIKSLFLDPTITGEGKDMNFSIESKDRKAFRIMKNGVQVGDIKTTAMLSGDLQYEIEIENVAFDDYIPLFAVTIDKAFGEINRNK